MSFAIENYPPEVESHPSSQPFTLHVRPVAESGVPLRGALVKYLVPGSLDTVADTYDGSNLASFDARGDEVPRGFVAVYHYGRRVSSTLVGEEDLTQTATREYTLEVKGGTSGAPEEFGGINSLEWVGDELVATWTPPRHAGAGAYAVSAAKDTELDQLFTANDDDLKNKHPPAFRDLTIPAKGAPVTNGATHHGWLWYIVAGFKDSPTEEAMTLLKKGDASYARFPNTGFFDEKVNVGAKTRRQGRGRSDNNLLIASAYDDNPGYNTGSNVTGVTISPDPGTVVKDDAYILTANVSGDGSHDPTVTWSSNGPTIVTSGPERCLVEADQSGDVTATSNADGSITNSITIDAQEYPANGTPAAPSGVSWRNARPPGTVQISWDDTAGELSHYRLYLSETESERDTSPRIDTYRSRLRVGDLSAGTTYYAGLVSVHPDGNESTMATFTITPEDVSGEKAGRRTIPPKEQKIAPGESRTVDLSNKVHVTPTASTSDQSTLWGNAEITVRRASGSSPISVSVSGSEITVSADGSASTDHGPEPVLVKVENGDRVPVWTGFMANVTPSTGTGPEQITDVPAQQAGNGFDPGEIVGGSPSTVDLSAWAPQVERHAHLAGLSINDNGVGHLDPGEARDGTPAIAAMSGDKGNTLIVISREPEPGSTLPQLPSENLSKAERASGSWSDVRSSWLDSLGPGSATHRWRRVLTGSSRLYDVSLMHPAAELRYQAPQYYRNFWLDQDQYPEDTELDSQKGRVVYRGGLESPSAGPVDPTVGELQAEAGPARVWADWKVSLDGDVKDGITVPVELWPQGSPNKSKTRTGTDTVTFSGLSAGTTYVIDLFGTQDTAEVLNPPATVSVTGYATEGGKYAYEYTVEESNLQSWTDHFGGTHSPGTVTVKNDKSVSEHTVGLQWPSESRERAAETEWRLPPSPISFTADVQTGQAVLTAEAEGPTFFARRFSGERTAQLAYNAYPEGSWEVYPVGYLPLPAEGELEDYVQTVFLSPGGEEMGQSVELSRPTELAVRLTIESAGTLSPIVYGARVEPSS